ncbi:hypothetical protein [Vibrio brasiliensis]|uniref:Uncharacterized protein n=1 Tax=Vibrio brasiliensis LMG 20546 TaxID=945543 RepID=E8LZM5_9VIBR|nr:hypothetical protein [Vibrio brasiliensis]EGA63910.1 hypothetical protein VIBR0546_02424 [Vibrio brasiliensis LMG 20546]
MNNIKSTEANDRTSLFRSTNVQAIIKRFLNNTKDNPAAGGRERVRLDIVRAIVGLIIRNPDDWDENCPFNIEHRGNSFIEDLRSFSYEDPKAFLSIYTDSVRFLLEYDFLTDASRQGEHEIAPLISKITEDYGSLEVSSDDRWQLHYAFNIMPGNILKKFLANNNIKSAVDFKERLDDAERLKKEWDAELETKEKTVGELSGKLNTLKTAYNFVGLYQGFDKLSEDKKTEQKWLFWSLVGMAILILTPLVLEFWALTFGEAAKTFDGLGSLVRLMPLVSIEVILIYFFRIILMNYRSVKTQVMQIELRKTLCSFIQGYAEYAKGIKEKDSDLLDRFENLIFSGIISDSEKLPSTFDGLEQLGNMIKNIKK